MLCPKLSYRDLFMHINGAISPKWEVWVCYNQRTSSSHLLDSIMQMYSTLSGRALKSRCIQTKGTERLSVAGRGCNSGLVKRKLLQKKHESRGTRSGAISLEVRAQCANMPQNGTDIKARKWIINGNIRQTASTYGKSLTHVKSKYWLRFGNRKKYKNGSKTLPKIKY